MDSLGYRLRHVRTMNNITLEELSEILGVTKSTISRYENNKRIPNADFIQDFANYFKVSADYLLGHIDQYNYNQKSVYDIDGDIAAHLDGKEYSEEAKKSILDFVDFVDSQQDKN